MTASSQAEQNAHFMIGEFWMVLTKVKFKPRHNLEI